MSKQRGTGKSYEGFFRHVDDLGRIALPKVIRELFLIESGDTFEVEAVEDGILLRRKEDPVEAKINKPNSAARVLVGTRRVDGLGRTVIPRTFRLINNIEEGTELDVFTQGDEVIYRKHQATEEEDTRDDE